MKKLTGPHMFVMRLLKFAIQQAGVTAHVGISETSLNDDDDDDDDDDDLLAMIHVHDIAFLSSTQSGWWAMLVV
ncbi:hypothetical protein E2C01_033138 [Portunus trituberculatus]|uniref:Uncharacterized protein n=1 Tax=Portunus trituberculatus TaxID=210409 RepID=A0A5B7F279_PORTR|nr:hypothetical protein [Portunus trituberculatus]